jgi:UDP:flavonoid glycosyltransferase YjiC (YdhE family)
MGTSGDITLLDVIVEGLLQASCVGMVATAGRTRINSVSDSIYHADYLPGLDAAKKASLVICNGGSATAYQALSQGTPILGFPSNADQFFTMESIQRLGAGLLIRPEDVSPKTVRDSLGKILKDHAFKEAANRLSREISLNNCTKLFPEFITEIAEQNRGTT